MRSFSKAAAAAEDDHANLRRNICLFMETTKSEIKLIIFKLWLEF